MFTFEVGIEPVYASHMAALNGAFKDLNVTINDQTDDFSTMIVATSSSAQPPVFYLYDTKNRTLDVIGEAFPELSGVKFQRTEFITYKSRDGPEIPAYVTKPANLKKTAPLVLVVHGGPAARDFGNYSNLNFMWVQFLASRGYVVLQPQYRGSKGFGEDFQRAGDHQGGRKMNADIIDGVKELVRQGLVDPKRVCITGWSWGGFSTLAAMTLTPDEWACGVAGAGVADPEGMIRYVNLREGGADGTAGEEITGTDYWISVMGEPGSKEIHEISAVDHVDGLKSPLLLFHGDKDIVVPYEQSKKMWTAMQRAGKKGGFITLPGEDHHITLEASRMIFLKEMGDFLDSNLHPDPDNQGKLPAAK